MYRPNGSSLIGADLIPTARSPWLQRTTGWSAGDPARGLPGWSLSWAVSPPNGSGALYVASFFSGGAFRIWSSVRPVAACSPFSNCQSAYIIIAMLGMEMPSRLTQCIRASS